MSIRNGRFKSARKIIAGRANTFFRILNSGEFNNSTVNLNAFTVTFGTGAGNNAVVLPTFSLDFFARDDVSVALTGSGTVEGMYEALPNGEFKSGRFKTKPGMDPTAGVPIITSGAGNASAIYRIFNSGPVPLQLFTRNPSGGGDTNLESPIAADESLDFVTPNNKIVLVKGTLTANDHIEGIYEFLGMP